MKRNGGVRIAVVTCLMVVLLCAAAFAAPPGAGWPGKKGELCWTADAGGGEITMVVLHITNMGGAHYLLNGGAYSWDQATQTQIGDLVAVLGSAEIDAEDPNAVKVIATIYHAEILTGPDRIEKFGGRMELSYDTLNGWVAGLSTICENPFTAQDPPASGVCDWMTTGQITMTKVACP